MMSNSRISGEVKIGRSNNVRRRRNNLQQTQNFYVVVHAVFPGRGNLEHYFHAMFASRRVQNVPGQEWFAISPKEAVDGISTALHTGI